MKEKKELPINKISNNNEAEIEYSDNDRKLKGFFKNESAKDLVAGVIIIGILGVSGMLFPNNYLYAIIVGSACLVLIKSFRRNWLSDLIQDIWDTIKRNKDLVMIN